MEREIKFRAWDGENMLQGQDLMNITLGQALTWSDRLMQFTGLKDKNGKEIYDGDVVGSLNDVRYIVMWNGERAKWSVQSKNGDVWGFDVFGANNAEVIGNIYENPELVK